MDFDTTAVVKVPWIAPQDCLGKFRKLGGPGFLGVLSKYRIPCPKKGLITDQVS